MFWPKSGSSLGRVMNSSVQPAKVAAVPCAASAARRSAAVMNSGVSGGGPAGAPIRSMCHWPGVSVARSR
ncbi:hypothetical protein [Saccharopolyspora antimicrobica]|uniref:hypothetical protein n=1 Tax=Saccharopolyspora antimicrobica TaxID=455193 RepID=UPI001BA683A6|nr:hypothetical protein [Saccharopolyspora antimicrobica]